ncbi:hypothetical protein A8709_03330 [Paenibacillus pectinilyticus]|uniref:Uncharacterized protein n=1 Tax=Paenibacillus pectinilyticus TaxID=512399 RepID=A0A1C0ZZ45_9BACL|nr:hypothetical protein [Paenibacillus pectinilyticus]OCT13301.1 hypothetical protein A8709_03330 [Paenibacillus pectinilyticus]
MRMNILFNKKPITVNFVGTDHKLIPSLINALRYNKFTTMNLVNSLEHVDLFSSEAILYATDGNKARIPIF